MKRAWYDSAPALLVGFLFLVGGIRNERQNQAQIRQLDLNFATIARVREEAEQTLALTLENAAVLAENQRIHRQNATIVKEMREKLLEIKGQKP